ncbi:unnamed protein product [Cuscuta epithymum]|uniref:X8 domain-containing protein n=1 Tax=Cuscuta epithymum TaxID=186058 RepID=A0AAV0G795_9ASTE|nr:unnamed protein product [Cuscuta epithymum]
MSSLLYAFLFMAMAAHSDVAGGATYCVCKEGMSESMLQKTLDYACGYGADCNPTHQNGPCFQPNTVKAHCSYAVNSFFQKKGQAPGTCDFSGTASTTSSDPSTTTCVFPASASGATTSTGNPSTTTSNSGVMTSPTGDTLGTGINNGFGPPGVGNSNADMNEGGISLLRRSLVPSISTILFSAVAALRMA